jgi:hypothetical protein
MGQHLSLAWQNFGVMIPECHKAVKSWWKKEKENPLGASLYKEQKKNLEERQKFMASAEKAKIWLNIQNMTSVSSFDRNINIG